MQRNFGKLWNDHVVDNEVTSTGPLKSGGLDGWSPRQQHSEIISHGAVPPRSRTGSERVVVDSTADPRTEDVKVLVRRAGMKASRMQ